jgi:hypothetical protein
MTLHKAAQRPKANHFPILKNLVGLKITLATHAASMRGFIFAPSAESPDAKQWAIYIQCPWRIETADGIVTDSGDWYQPADLSAEKDDWDPADGEPHGGVIIWLTGDCALRLFPAASRGEHWRVFYKGDTSSHVICEA